MDVHVQIISLYITCLFSKTTNKMLLVVDLLTRLELNHWFKFMACTDMTAAVERYEYQV